MWPRSNAQTNNRRFACACLSRPRDGRVRQIAWMRALVTLSAMVGVLLSSSYGQEPASQKGDAGAGQQVFNNACRTCHTTREGDNRFGPTLYKIIGRKAGSLPGYGYSEAMKEADFVWDEAKLDRFIANPDKVVSGNNMQPYGGVASAADRVKVISFLRSVASGQ
jgi:cytochrome c